MTAELIDAKIAGLGDWRGAMLATLRAPIHAADPDVDEMMKWQTPTNKGKRGFSDVSDTPLARSIGQDPNRSPSLPGAPPSRSRRRAF